ncbi:MAG: DUF4136 domain-containing protein [Acidobacteriaceae bacterium]|nr:DUF4136 domain-containing protein [Acidobacteriaceae bacterium]
MRSTPKAMTMIGIALFLAAISFAQQIKTDYDRNADFRQYKTFSFEKIQTENPLWVDRITSAVSTALTQKGLTQVSSGGDISIVAVEMTKDHETLNTFYDSFGGGWGWRWGGDQFGDATTTTDTYRVGTLVVDLFDTKSKKLVWRGSESDALSDKSSKNIKNLDKGVEKLFREFPPKA